MYFEYWGFISYQGQTHGSAPTDINLNNSSVLSSYHLKKLLMLFLFLFATQNVSAESTLTKMQLYSVLGIITNYILLDSSDTTAPNITSDNNATVDENQLGAIILEATDDGNIT
ncbi:MAG: hypothetical protein Q9M36_03560 [Sulfurovum sp.]|nr:hypothetical protein [Sulfurovum sp.]